MSQKLGSNDSPAHDSESTTPARWVRGAVVLLIVLLPVLSISSSWQKSAIYDETVHLSAGLSYLTTGDFRMNPEHPPLPKLVAGLFVELFTEVELDLESESWRTGKQGRFGHSLLNRWNSPDRLLRLGRLATVLVSLALALSVFTWARKLFGEMAGLLALVCTVLDANLLAHSRFVTSDIWFAAGFFWTVWAAAAVMERATPGRALLLAAAVAFSAVVKFSAVLIVPVLILLALMRVLIRAAWPVSFGSWELECETRKARIGLVAVLALIVVAVSWVSVWGAYGFRSTPFAADQPIPESWTWERQLQSGGPVARTLESLRDAEVLPEAYLYGLAFVQAHAQQRSSYAAGRFSYTGFRWYFLYAFMAKTSLPILVLLAWAVCRRRGREQISAVTAATIAIPVAVYAIASIFSSLNIGHRHLLPIYPLLYVSLGLLTVGGMRKAERLALLVLSSLLLVSTIVTYPHYLSSFNILFGGSSGGYRALIDSNLDWGQDLKGLAQELGHRGIERVNLAYFGTASPRAYGLIPFDAPPDEEGIRYTRLVGNGIADEDAPNEVAFYINPPPGCYAISATLLVGTYLGDLAAIYRPFLDALEDTYVPGPTGSRIEPIGSVGHSIYLFEVLPPRSRLKDESG